MNIRQNETDKSANNKNDEGLLEKIAKTIDPPSREVSDAELADPGANTPTDKPRNPERTPVSGAEHRQSGKNPSDKRGG